MASERQRQQKVQRLLTRYIRSEVSTREVMSVLLRSGYDQRFVVDGIEAIRGLLYELPTIDGKER